jgi:hypothetical protein
MRANGTRLSAVAAVAALLLAVGLSGCGGGGAGSGQGANDTFLSACHRSGHNDKDCNCYLTYLQSHDAAELAAIADKWAQVNPPGAMIDSSGLLDAIVQCTHY